MTAPAPTAPSRSVIAELAQRFAAELITEESMSNQDPEEMARRMRDLLAQPEFMAVTWPVDRAALRATVYRLLAERCALMRVVTIVTLGQEEPS